jgi:hypothetical protein
VRIRSKRGKHVLVYEVIHGNMILNKKIKEVIFKKTEVCIVCIAQSGSSQYHVYTLSRRSEVI